MRKCCFCGHGNPSEIEPFVSNRLSAFIEFLIVEKQVYTFYSGGMGAFDRLAEGAVRKLKQTYPQIRLCYVVPYLSEKLNSQKAYYEKKYDEIIHPDLGRVYYKAAIQKRNRWMIDKSNYMIAYVKNNYGGARQSYTYAQKQNIEIINLADATQS